MNNYWEVAKYVGEVVWAGVGGDFKLFVCEEG